MKDIKPFKEYKKACIEKFSSLFDNKVPFGFSEVTEPISYLNSFKIKSDNIFNKLDKKAKYVPIYVINRRFCHIFGVHYNLFIGIQPNGKENPNVLITTYKDSYSYNAEYRKYLFEKNNIDFNKTIYFNSKTIKDIVDFKWAIQYVYDYCNELKSLEVYIQKMKDMDKRTDSINAMYFPKEIKEVLEKMNLPISDISVSEPIMNNIYDMDYQEYINLYCCSATFKLYDKKFNFLLYKDCKVASCSVDNYYCDDVYLSDNNNKLGTLNKEGLINLINYLKYSKLW